MLSFGDGSEYRLRSHFGGGADACQGCHGLEALKSSLMENCSFQAQCLNKFDFSPGNSQAQNVLYFS